MKPVIVWGTGSLAEMARFFLDKSNVVVAAHVVDPEYVTSTTFQGKPVIPSTELSKFGSNTHDAFVALGYKQNNDKRQEKIEFLKGQKYSLISVQSSSSIVHMGPLPPNSFIMDSVIIEPFVSMGAGNIFWSGSQICHHTKIQDYNFFGPRALICGDVKIGSNCFFGGNSTVRDGLKVGNRVVLGAGTLATENLEDKCVLTQKGLQPFRSR